MNAKIVWAAAAALSTVACSNAASVTPTELPTSAEQQLVAQGAVQAKAAESEAPSKAKTPAKQNDEAIEVASAKVPLADIEAACANKKGICTPSSEVVARLCKRIDPNLALAMFRRGTPWKRVYARGDMEAWYAQQGRTRPRNIRYAEELIILADRTDAGDGMKMSGFGNYDVYRWDGSCVSLMTNEVTKFRPSTPDLATVQWRQLSSAVQDALTVNKKIAFRNGLRKSACKGRQRHSEDCKYALHDLSRVIADHVWRGGDIPIPKWIP